MVGCWRQKHLMAQMSRHQVDHQFGCLYHTHIHTHTHLTALCPGLPGCAGTRKATPIWILLKQETVSGSGISWAICKSAPSSRQITTPAPHHSVFYRPDALPAAQPTASKHWRHKTLTVDVDASTTLSPNEVRNRTEFQPFSAELSVILGPGFAILHGNLTLTLSPILTWDSLTVQRQRHLTTHVPTILLSCKKGHKTVVVADNIAKRVKYSCYIW